MRSFELEGGFIVVHYSLFIVNARRVVHEIVWILGVSTEEPCQDPFSHHCQ